MRKSLKVILSVLFVFTLSCHLFATDGIVTFVKGKVEVKRGSEWVALKVGDKVAQSEMINTGFQSEAKVKLMESVLYLGPVTRVTLDKLASSSDRDKVNVYLSTGSVRSKVNRSGDKKMNYTVRTPIAVASVRGTDFSVDDSNRVETYEGSVAVSTVKAVYGDNERDDDESDEDDEDEEEESESDDSSELESSSESDDLETESSDDDVEEKDADSEESVATDKDDADKKVSDKGVADKDTADKNVSDKDVAGTDSDNTNITTDKGVADTSGDLENNGVGNVETPSSGATNAGSLDSGSGFNGFEDSAGVPEHSASSVVVTAGKGTQVVGGGKGGASAGVGPAKHSVERKSSNIVASVTTEATKQAPKVEVPISAAVDNIVSGGQVNTPKTGSINVHIKLPSTGNVSVEVVLPQ